MKFNRKAEPSQGASGDKYLKLKSGESINGVFSGELHEYFIKWENGKSVIAKDGEPGARLRFESNFITRVDGRFVAKIFGFPMSVYLKLKAINSEYGDITAVKVKITRHGELLETEWDVLPVKDQPSAQELLQIRAVDLNILNKSAAPKPAPSNGWDANDSGPDEIDDLPF